MVNKVKKNLNDYQVHGHTDLIRLGDAIVVGYGSCVFIRKILSSLSGLARLGLCARELKSFDKNGFRIFVHCNED